MQSSLNDIKNYTPNTLPFAYSKQTGLPLCFGAYFYMNNVGINKSLKHRWNAMKDRCYNNKSKQFSNYGGRGITICDEWRYDYSKFELWAINNGFEINLTIDRINNNGNYEPSNCRWVDMKTQILNRRKMKNTQNTDKGVYEIKNRKLKKPFKSYVYDNYKTYVVGYFSTKEEAIKAREEFIIS